MIRQECYLVQDMRERDIEAIDQYYPTLIGIPAIMVRQMTKQWYLRELNNQIGYEPVMVSKGVEISSR